MAVPVATATYVYGVTKLFTHAATQLAVMHLIGDDLVWAHNPCEGGLCLHHTGVWAEAL